MRRPTLFAVTLGLVPVVELVSTTGLIGQEPDRDRAVIEWLARDYGRAFELADVDGILKLVTEDFLALTPDKPPLPGRETVRQAIEGDDDV